MTDTLLKPALMTPSPQTIGDRIQRTRLRQDLSVRDLAERAGVNKNTILRLEKGFTPSYSTLNRVCTALGIHVAQLTEPEPDEGETIALHSRGEEVRQPFSLLRISNGSLEQTATVLYQEAAQRQPIASDERVFLSTLACRLPGGRLNAAVLELFAESEPVTHPGEELVFCLRGIASLTVAGRSYILREGDAAAFWCSEQHSYGPSIEAEDNDALPVLLLSVWIDAREDRSSSDTLK